MSVFLTYIHPVLALHYRNLLLAGNSWQSCKVLKILCCLEMRKCRKDERRGPVKTLDTRDAGKTQALTSELPNWP